MKNKEPAWLHLSTGALLLYGGLEDRSRVGQEHRSTFLARKREFSFSGRATPAEMWNAISTNLANICASEVESPSSPERSRLQWTLSMLMEENAISTI